MSLSNDEGVFSTVHAAVAAGAESTTDDSDNSGGVKGPVVPGVKGNNDVAVSKVNERKNSVVDDMSGNDPVSEVIVGGGEVAIQEKRGDNDNTDLFVNVDKAEVGSVDKDETESDEVGKVEDTNEDVQVKVDDDSSYIAGTSFGDNDHDEDDAVGGNNDNSDDMGEDKTVEEVIVAEDKAGGDETITKKQQQHHDTWVNNYNNMVTFYNTNGHCIAKRNVDTAECKKLGNWVHDQRKKFKAGTLADDRVSLLSELEFDFSMQTNVVDQKLTVPIAISRIFKYKKVHGNVAVPNTEPHKQLRRWIVHAKATSKKIIAQGSGNPKFTLPNLKLLHELGTIQLPPNFKLLEETTTKMATKKDNKTTKAPPKSKSAPPQRPRRMHLSNRKYWKKQQQCRRQ
jgi:hypothetical protein